MFQLEAESAKADSNELGLDNVGGVFVVLIAGTLAAFLMAILELLWNCRKIAVEEKVSTNYKEHTKASNRPYMKSNFAVHILST